MAKGKLTRKNCLTSVKSRNNPKPKSRKNSVYSRRAVKKNQPPISYKESHSIGRRQSTHVPTYNESGRLYFDLYVKYGPTDCFANKEDKVTKESNHSCGFDSDISDTTTVACNDASSHSPGKKKLYLKKKREQTSRRNQNVVQSPRSSVLYTRREASLNAEAKVNMLFESPKECRLKRKSVPVSLTPKVREDVSGPINENSDCPSSRRRASRLRISDPPISYSPPKKRLAGLNATAIISAFMKSPKPTPSSDAKHRRCGKQSKASPSQLAGQDDSLVNVERQSACIVSSNQSQVPTHSNPLTAVAMVSSDTKPRPASVVPTVERFQSHKVISYGPKCIGVENISRQIIHVPSQNQSLPGPSCSSPVPQRLFTQSCSSTPPRTASPVMSTANVSPQQNHSMFVFPDTSFNSSSRLEPLLPADVHTCFPSQFYVGPFGHPSALQPHTFFMSPTLIHSIPPSPFHFLHTSPFATTYMHSPAPMPTNYMLPMPVSPIYNAFPHSGFGSCVVPRPVFSTHQMPPPAPAAPAPPQPTSLACELGSSQVRSTLACEPPKRVDRAVSPMPEMKCDSASSSACNVLVKKTPTKRVSPEKKQAPCLWVWEGTPNERPVFVKPDSPPVARMCYPSMRHEKDGMVVCPGDNVLLCSGPDRHSAPHVAKVTALFDNPDNGTKMMALLWYYRPDSLTPPRRSGVVECELFASRHCDVNPVDCIDDRAYVLSAAPYARFMALAKYKQEARSHRRPISAVPRIAAATPRDATATSTSTEVFAGDISEFPEDAIPSNVFLCRAWYDFRSRRVIRHLKSLNSNLDNGGNSNNGSFSNSSKPSHQQQQQQHLDTSSPVQPPAVNSSRTLLTLAPPLLSLPSPPVLPPEEEAAENEAVEEIPDGRTVLEKTADISINWGDHGEQIALSLGGAPLLPSPKKPDAAPVTSSPTSATTPTSAPGPVPTSTSQPPHMLLSSSSPS
ncbi:bromo adjacent y domain containing 1 [Echinococcus multilocularis]|uniref:Bromo adjacent y domain containing 1 n=1 Tax=Echinococcus multilocularis TaxID=6211 RepID=A0A087W1L2_ECHMU|nr:bromo adjacent y domain containing 1 [Echinococcus multilocularis]